jgi:hypothetical protein
MTGLLPPWVYEFHPHDWLFVFPVAASVLCFGSRRRHFILALLIATCAAVALSLFAMMIEIGRPWALIGVTGTFIFGLYLPICLAAGLLLEAARWIGRASAREKHAQD